MNRLELDLETPLTPRERRTLKGIATDLLADLGASPTPGTFRTWADACRWLDKALA